MTPTPRTDACKFYLALCNNDLPTDAVCPAEKMAELERENAELRAIAEKALKQMCRATAPDGTYTATVDELDRILQAARSALGEGGSAPEPLPGQKNASTGRTGAREGI